jgi:hypothetical protein
MARRIITSGIKIGEGSCRKVYATKYGKWAVKVNIYRKVYGGNTTEYNTYLDFKNKPLPEGVKIPEMHLLKDGILVVERIKGKHPTNWCENDFHVEAVSGDEYEYSTECPGLDKCWAEKTKDVKIKDLHPYNVKVLRDGTVYIIDLGHGEGN